MERVATLIVVTEEGIEICVGEMAERPDLACVDRLAKLHLAARRAGMRVVVRDPHPNLCGLLELCGLSGLIALEPLGQPEVREQVGVDEVVQPRDLPP
jgi:hypothetical protein